MSTLKVESIQHPESSTPAITLSASGGMSGSFPYPNRNLLYNGAMQVAQRGTSTAGITNQGGYFTADRWYFNTSTMGTWTESVEADGPTGSGFTKSLKILCTTADASPAAGDSTAITYRIEGQDLQRVAKGTSSAQELTISFWVKSNVTGTYIAGLNDADNSRYVAASYTVNASATWEKKSITFPSDSIGALDNDNAESLRIYLWLGAGSDRTSGTLPLSWESTTVANLAVGQTNLASAINNYWQVTGVQLEVGDTATGFEFKSYGQELAECQRYYRFYDANGYGALAPLMGNSSTLALGALLFPVEMRSAPTAITSSNLQVTDYISVYNATSVNIGELTRTATRLDVAVASGLTQYRPYVLRGNGTAGAYLAISAEL